MPPSVRQAGKSDGWMGCGGRGMEGDDQTAVSLQIPPWALWVAEGAGILSIYLPVGMDSATRCEHVPLDPFTLTLRTLVGPQFAPA